MKCSTRFARSPSDHKRVCGDPVCESLRARGFKHLAFGNGCRHRNSASCRRLELWKDVRLFVRWCANPSGTRALREYLDEFVAAPVTLVFGVMRDKNLEQMAGCLFRVANKLVLTRPDNPRAASMDELLKLALRIVEPQKIFCASSLRDAIREALEATPPDGLICFSGSLYLIGEAQSAINEMHAAEVPN